MKQSRDRRKISSMRLTLKYQMRFFGMWVFMSVVMALALMAGSYIISEQLWRSFLALQAPLAMDAFVNSNPLMGFLVTSSVLLIAGILALGVTSGHRIAAPYLALQRTFNAIQQGNLNYRLHFRQNHHLEDIETSFNEMMNVLQTRVEGKKISGPALKVVGE